MQNLQSQTLTLKASVLTPIHIWSGENWDRLDYFLVEEHGQKYAVFVSKKWLDDLVNKIGEQAVKQLAQAIKEGDMIKLENLKIRLFSKVESKYVLKKIPVSNGAWQYLSMEGKQYNKNQIRGNQGEIRKFVSSGNCYIVPGSTLKGILRTIFLIEKKVEENELNISYIKLAESLEKQNNSADVKRKFAFLWFEDTSLEDKNFEIQNIRLATERGQLPIVAEVLKGGDFVIKIAFDRNYFNIQDLKRWLEKYSEIMIKREERILSKFGKQGFINRLREYKNAGKLPIKIGMFKKALTYKLFWEEVLEDVYTKLVEILKQVKNGEYINLKSEYEKLMLWKFGFKDDKDFIKWVNRFKNNPRLKSPYQYVGLKLGLGDRSFYMSEQDQPMGWLLLEM